MMGIKKMGMTLEELAERAKKSLPEQIVIHALQLVYADLVHFKGGNMWGCDGYEVNHYSKSCTCPDKYHVHEKWGKICPHHVAVMLERRYQDENPKGRMTLDEIFMKDGLTEIRIRWDYESDKRTVIGYVDSSGFVGLMSDDVFETNYNKFSFALHKNGFSMSMLPFKLEGSFDHVYRYKVERGDSGIILTETNWHTKSVTTSMSNANKRKQDFVLSEQQYGKLSDNIKKSNLIKVV